MMEFEYPYIPKGEVTPEVDLHLVAEEGGEIVFREKHPSGEGMWNILDRFKRAGDFVVARLRLGDNYGEAHDVGDVIVDPATDICDPASDAPDHDEQVVYREAKRNHKGEIIGAGAVVLVAGIVGGTIYHNKHKA